MLLPMYFLVGIWGGPKREFAAIKFFRERSRHIDGDGDEDAAIEPAAGGDH